MDNRQKLKEIVKYVSRSTGVDITTKSRRTDIADARALYYMIALKDTRASMNVIGEAVGRSHATVIHTRNNVFSLIENDIFYMNIFKSYFGLELEVGHNRFAGDEILTKNERAYRRLSDEDRKIYDDRALLVLKSFEWKRKEENREEVFEKIYIGC